MLVSITSTLNPRLKGMIQQFLSEVRWGELDYLIIDTPPGAREACVCVFWHLLTDL